MGQADRRGTFEERKEKAVAKSKERLKNNLESLEKKDGKLNTVGQELPKHKRSGRAGVAKPLAELRSPIQSLIG